MPYRTGSLSVARSTPEKIAPAIGHMVGAKPVFTLKKKLEVPFTKWRTEGSNTTMSQSYLDSNRVSPPGF